ELGEGAKLSDGSTATKLVWISGSEATYVKNLPDGTYTLHEVAAPNGYKVATDITFTIVNGVVTGEAVTDGDTVVMVDETAFTDVKISKQDVNSKELSGAKLTLTGKDINGNEVTFNTENVELGEGAKLSDGSTATKLVWISGSEATYVKNLPDGTYTLHEVSAPNGYKVATDITFTIENGVVKGEAVVDGDTVVMVDEKKDTSNNNNNNNSNNSSNKNNSSNNSSSSKNKSSSSSKNSSNTRSTSPQTGVEDMSTMFFLMAIAVATAFLARSKKNEKD
ncbi:MAG: hypothetical protein J6B74_05560, partial [Ruminococcus sp.]|nr:hypothetical protein [Ruminococcus sp.]